MKFERLVKERYGVVVLALLFFICTAFTLSHPHSFEHATVPDEKSYYGWGLLYNQGIYHVPLYDWYGVQTGMEFYVNASGLHFLVLRGTVVDGGGKGLNVGVRVTFETGVPVPGAQVRLFSQRPRIDVSGTTNSTGSVLFTDILEAPIMMEASYFKPPSGGNLAVNLHVEEMLDTRGVGEPYSADVEVTSFTPSPPGYQMELRVVDSLSTPVPDAAILYGLKISGQPPQEAGVTDAQGTFILASSQAGSQIVLARKDSQRGMIPIASVVPYGGTYVAVNHWAPGYSIVLGLMERGSAAGLTNVLMMALALVATYLLARRLLGWRVALVAGVLVLTCAVALLLIWTSGMADYASMAFATTGMWLFVEAVWPARRWLEGAILGALGGMSLGVAVWIRYSTGSVLIAALFLLVAMTVKDWREMRERGRLSFELLKRLLLRAVPFSLGLLVLLVPLAVYNSTYFGGPLGASHN